MSEKKIVVIKKAVFLQPQNGQVLFMVLPP